MWICSRCQSANKDGYTQCVQCSAPRNARRFGAGNPVNAPSVQAADSERRMQPQDQKEAAPTPRRQAPEPAPGKVPRAPGGLVRLVGALLALLLPLAVLATAIAQSSVLLPAIAGLFIKEGAAASPVPGYFIYGVFTALSMLLAMAPGFSLWALGHIARGIRRR